MRHLGGHRVSLAGGHERVADAVPEVAGEPLDESGRAAVDVGKPGHRGTGGDGADQHGVAPAVHVTASDLAMAGAPRGGTAAVAPVDVGAADARGLDAAGGGAGKVAGRRFGRGSGGRLDRGRGGRLKRVRMRPAGTASP
jgi:hypothetical protein